MAHAGSAEECQEQGMERQGAKSMSQKANLNIFREKSVTGIFNPNGHHIQAYLLSTIVVQSINMVNKMLKIYNYRSLFFHSFPISPSFHLHLICPAANIILLIHAFAKQYVYGQIVLWLANKSQVDI